MEEHFEELGKGKGKERMEIMTDKAEKASGKISEIIEQFLRLPSRLQIVPHPLVPSI